MLDGSFGVMTVSAGFMVRPQQKDGGLPKTPYQYLKNMNANFVESVETEALSEVVMYMQTLLGMLKMQKTKFFDACATVAIGL